MEPTRDASPIARGFTLVELIVVLAIIIIITTITITTQINYNRSLIITNTAYSVALSIREAQTLGLSSRNFGGVQNAGYGVYIQEGDLTRYRVFADIDDTNTNGSWCPTGTTNTPEEKPGNCLYDEAAGEVLTTYNLNRGFRIDEYCGILTNNNRACGGSYWRSLNITFLRPNTEAVMTMRADNGSVAQLKCAVIWIAPPNGDNRKCIVVSQVGQVSVPQLCSEPNLMTSCP